MRDGDLELRAFAPADAEALQALLAEPVRKVSGSAKPSRANAEAFERAVDVVALTTTNLLEELVAGAPPKDREAEAAKRRARAAERYAA